MTEMARYEIYVVDSIKASIYWGAPVENGFIVSSVTAECAVSACRGCGIMHGIAAPEILQKNGLAARRV